MTTAKRTTPRAASARAVAKATGAKPAGAKDAPDQDKPSDTPPPPPPPAIETLNGSSTLPALIEIGPAKVQLGEIGAAAHKASGLTLEAWNALDKAARDKLLGAEIAEWRAAAEPTNWDLRNSSNSKLGGLFFHLMEELEANRALANPDHPDHQVAESLPAEIPAGKLRIRVIGPRAGRRRLGRQFATEPTEIDVTADEFELLRGDSTLTVKPVAPD
jgi:hypothetical protein